MDSPQSRAESESPSAGRAAIILGGILLQGYDAFAEECEGRLAEEVSQALRFFAVNPVMPAHFSGRPEEYEARGVETLAAEALSRWETSQDRARLTEDVRALFAKVGIPLPGVPISAEDQTRLDAQNVKSREANDRMQTTQILTGIDSTTLILSQRRAWGDTSVDEAKLMKRIHAYLQWWAMLREDFPDMLMAAAQPHLLALESADAEWSASQATAAAGRAAQAVRDLLFDVEKAIAKLRHGN